VKSVKTLLLLADDAHARFLENRGVGKGLTTVHEVRAADFDAATVRYSDRPGRMQGGGGPTSALDRSTSEENQERLTFAKHVAEQARAMFQKGGYDRFALAAAPKMLGLLRQQLGNELTGKLSFDLGKDLIKIPDDKLPDHFADLAAF